MVMMRNKVWRKKTSHKEKPNIVCDVCGYGNKYYWVKRSGVCNGCGKVLDEKAYFKKTMMDKLHIVGSRKWKY